MSAVETVKAPEKAVEDIEGGIYVRLLSQPGYARQIYREMDTNIV